jgi:hypothetical protein
VHSSFVERLRRRIRRRRLRARVAVRRAALGRARTQDGDRLLIAPVFILSSVRSGSTLLRVMLNSHSELHAPHEVHLVGLTVRVESKHTKQAMAELGLDEEHVQFLMWDRVLHRELVHHGKATLVEKTPSDALMWRKILRCWPDARFIFLLRHPGAVTDSWQRGRRRWTRDQVAAEVKRYMDAVEEARLAHGGLTVRYEDVTENPEREMRRVCEFLGIEYEPAMVDYGSASHGEFRTGLGDWSRRIRSGKVQPAKPIPPRERLPDVLAGIAEQWGYLD